MYDHDDKYHLAQYDRIRPSRSLLQFHMLLDSIIHSLWVGPADQRGTHTTSVAGAQQQARSAEFQSRACCRSAYVKLLGKRARAKTDCCEQRSAPDSAAASADLA